MLLSVVRSSNTAMASESCTPPEAHVFRSQVMISFSFKGANSTTCPSLAMVLYSFPVFSAFSSTKRIQVLSGLSFKNSTSRSPSSFLPFRWKNSLLRMRTKRLSLRKGSVSAASIIVAAVAFFPSRISEFILSVPGGKSACTNASS
ncbi:unknown [Clostridium sp. CAG:505]|nr:unknown [Clostridium sp. CAG:505]